MSDPAIVDVLDALFEPWNRRNAPGFTVGVSLAGRVLYRRGFGMASLETAVANGPATRMRIGSTSKHFTCLLILLLAEDGRIELDAPIGTYISELQGEVGRPTIRQLMLHRGAGGATMLIWRSSPTAGAPIPLAPRFACRRGKPSRISRPAQQ